MPLDFRERAATGLFLTLVLLSLFGLVHPWFEPVRDASVYITTAKSLLAGDGYSYLGVPFIARPPGFPVAIAPVLALFGTNFLALHLWVGLLGACAAGLCFLLFKERLGWPLAMAVATAIWLNPGFRRLSNEVMSDVPGLALLIACLLVERWASRRPSPGREAWLGLVIALAVSVRSLNAAVVPAIVLSRLWRGGFYGGGAFRVERRAVTRLAILLVVAAAFSVPWSLRNRAVASDEAVEQVAVADYSTAMWRVDRGDPKSDRLPMLQVLSRTRVRMVDCLNALGSRLRHGMPVPSPGPRELHPGPLLLAVLLLVGLATAALRARSPAELFAFACLAVLLVHVDFRSRLLLPVFVIALAGTAELVRDLWRRFTTPARAEAATLATFVVATLLDFSPRWEWDLIRRGHEAGLARAAAVTAALPGDAILATALGHRDTVLLGRPVLSLHLAARREGLAAAFDRLTRQHCVDYLVLSEHDPLEAQLLEHSRRLGLAGREIATALWAVRVDPAGCEPPGG
jgi:hypothetical protein